MNQASDHSFTLIINGDMVRVTGICPSLTLLEYLRQSGRTGTKEGCGDGDCGACTVAMIAPGTDGKLHYQAVNSCLMPIAALAGREILTIEGIAREQLHPVQAAMVQTGGSQCGYCTPGFIMSLFAAYYDGAIADSTVEGNLCRCTGYLAIRRAVQQIMESIAAYPPTDPFSQRLQQVNSDWSALTYTNQQQIFYRPTHLQTVLDLLYQHPTAVLIAGATDLGLELSHHRQTFPVLISLEAVAELQQITVTDTAVTIGAAVTLTTIAAQLRGLVPSLDEMLYWFAARQIRNRATIGGNIANASPIGDLPPVLLALDAELLIAGRQGNRSMAIADFFQGYRQTALQPGEVIVSVTIPRSLTPAAVRRLSQSYKVGKRGTDDISIVAAAFTIDLDHQGRIIHARLAYGGVAATPIRALDVEQTLLGQPWNLTTVQAVKPALREAFTPLTDMRGSAAYRCLLVANLFEKFFVECEAVNSEVGE
ncbi:xanthine dehydrogenase small subunit [Pantanalinema rosaneae CENA516]|uniref:xanthine dehydrogenase small subunit n=1 Tax=Pantanalinema rosaneae TaxID=1620701 RepID=UPI003D6E48EE